MFLKEMSNQKGSTDKTKIKTLVKRCRSFKEDILSRLARNRSKEDGRRSRKGGVVSGGTSPVPSSDSEVTDPILLIAHRLKEAYLTLQFVESLIQKNCVDLLGGSSNVLLELMGLLLNDIKGLTAVSHSAAYQSTVSQIKSALGDFLIAVDVLLLKERCDDVQKELYFEKVLETLEVTRDALARLKGMVETKERGAGCSSGQRHHSTCSEMPNHPVYPQLRHHSPLLASTPTPNTNKSSLYSPTSKSDGSSPFPLSPLSTEPPTPTTINTPFPVHEEPSVRILRPPLPPKLKQWTAKSFDSEWPPPTTSCSPGGGGSSASHHQHMANSSSANLSPRHQSLQTHNILEQWLEQSTPTSSHHHHRSLSQHQSRGKIRQHQLHSTSSASRFEQSETGPGWQESTVYVSRSSHSGASSTSTSNKHLAYNIQRKPRTYSDSYQLEMEAGESEESLEKLDYEYADSRSGRSGTTHNSQSLSLGSSLDNLLLVDSQSQQSGLSPNSNSNNSGLCAGSGKGNNRISVSSNLSGNLSGGGASGAQGLASLSNFDPDAEEDSDVFAPSEDSVPIETELDEPPNLPEKQNRRQFLLGQQQRANGQGHHTTHSHYFDTTIHESRCPSPYENVDECELATWHGGVDAREAFHSQQRQFMSYSESRNTLVGAVGCESDDRPPLPPKKKHSLIAAYVEFLHNFESYSQSQNQHHTHFHNHLNQIHHQHLQSQQQAEEKAQTAGAACTDAETQRRQFRQERSQTLHNPGTAVSCGFPRAPTRSPPSSTSHHHLNSGMFSPTEESPTHCNKYYELDQQFSPCGSEDHPQSPGHHHGLVTFEDRGNGVPPALPPKRSKNFLKSESSDDRGSCSNSPLCDGVVHTHVLSCSPPSSVAESSSPCRQIPTVTTPVYTSTKSMDSPQLSVEEQNIDLFITNVSPSMLVKNDNFNNKPPVKSASGRIIEIPEIKGGDPHLLILYAASPDLKEPRFREVFLLTYRTFVPPLAVVKLLWRRVQHFEQKSDRLSKVHMRATLELFVDVVGTLTPMDLEEEMVTKIRDCIYHLVDTGEIQSALKTRKAIIHKYQTRQKLMKPKPPPVTLAVTSEPQSLDQWSGTSIAQQMTLLDADLFRSLESAEMLLWAKDQNEELCPALTVFTEHFNKVSYWVRSRVLLCNTSRERNRAMKKMIQVMRKLREFNNYNSLLAVLAALDSAPIRRLGFSQRLHAALKPQTELTDSSGSFRSYRQALIETKPPCIPYIGLVLQDLTFVHIGNVDFLPDGKINWVKRWQQFICLEPVRKFQHCNYGFIKNDAIVSFMNNFEDSLNDDELWQLSETIKSRNRN